MSLILIQFSAWTHILLIFTILKYNVVCNVTFLLNDYKLYKIHYISFNNNKSFICKTCHYAEKDFFFFNNSHTLQSFALLQIQGKHTAHLPYSHLVFSRNSSQNEEKINGNVFIYFARKEKKV